MRNLVVMRFSDVLNYGKVGWTEKVLKEGLWHEI